MSAEDSECVCGEQGSGGLLVSHHHFRPVNHRGIYEGEHVLSGAQLFPLFHLKEVVVQVPANVVLQHVLDLGGRHDLGLRVTAHQLAQGRAVVRLHVVDDDVIQTPAIQQVIQVIVEHANHGIVHRIQHYGLLIIDKIRIIRHSLGHRDGPLEHGQLPVVAADPIHIFLDFSIAVHLYLLSAPRRMFF